MPELRVLSGREVCRILEAHGFVQDVGGTTTVPVPSHDEVRRGTLRSIIRQSGLPRELFEV